LPDKSNVVIAVLCLGVFAPYDCGLYCRRFGATCCSHLEAEVSREQKWLGCVGRCFLRPAGWGRRCCPSPIEALSRECGRWRWHVPPKRRRHSPVPHCSQIPTQNLLNYGERLKSFRNKHLFWESNHKCPAQISFRYLTPFLNVITPAETHHFVSLIFKPTCAEVLCDWKPVHLYSAYINLLTLMNSAVRVVCRRSSTVGLFNRRGRLLWEYPLVIN